MKNLSKLVAFTLAFASLNISHQLYAGGPLSKPYPDDGGKEPNESSILEKPTTQSAETEFLILMLDEMVKRKWYMITGQCKNIFYPLEQEEKVDSKDKNVYQFEGEILRIKDKKVLVKLIKITIDNDHSSYEERFIKESEKDPIRTLDIDELKHLNHELGLPDYRNFLNMWDFQCGLNDSYFDPVIFAAGLDVLLKYRIQTGKMVALDTDETQLLFG